MALDIGGDRALSRKAMKAELLDAETELQLAQINQIFTDWLLYIMELIILQTFHKKISQFLLYSSWQALLLL